MMHATGSLPGKWQPRFDGHMQLRGRPACAHLINVHSGSVLRQILPRGPHLKDISQDTVSAFELGDADRNRSEAANLMFGGHGTSIPRICFAISSIIDQAESLTLGILEIQRKAAVAFNNVVVRNIATLEALPPPL
jgi:hypothetical protein